jgi:hypothetical protein
MESLQSIAGKNGCGSSDGASLGKLGCQIEFGSPIYLFKLKKGTVIPKETVLTKAYLDNLTKLNTMVPISDASSFEDVSSEDSMSTNARNIERLSAQGLAKYKLTFEEGHEYYRQMAKLKSFKNSDFLIGDEYGNLKVAINSAGDFVGFSAGQVLPEMTKAKSLGGDSESKSVSVQFINRNQWDSDYTIFTSKQLGFDLIEIQGVNPVNVAFNSIPTAGTTIVLKAALSSDNSTEVTGLVLLDFILQVDLATVVATAMVESIVAGKTIYTFTIPAISISEVVTAQLGTAADNTNNVLNNGVLYDSNVASETTIA